jgi:hypothetical protein
LQTGVEHWKTNYQEEMAKSLSRTQGSDKWAKDQRAQSLKKAEEESKK